MKEFTRALLPPLQISKPAWTLLNHQLVWSMRRTLTASSTNGLMLKLAGVALTAGFAR